MTIISQAITSNEDKKQQPLVVEENTLENSKKDVEAQCLKSNVGRHYFVSRRSVYRINVIEKSLLFLITLIIILTGIIGACIYAQYTTLEMHWLKTRWYSITYDVLNQGIHTLDGYHSDLIADNDLSSKGLAKPVEQGDYDRALTNMSERVYNFSRSFFKEQFEIDLENGHYEKVHVLDFRTGRHDRFIHDFTINKTVIIDTGRQACLVMSLNYETVLPPCTLYEYLKKINNDDAEIDREIVRETLKIITPPITNMSIIGPYIAHECQGLSLFLVKRVNTNVVKRSISNAVFGQFAGKNIIEFDILNLDDIEAYNKNNSQN